MMRLMRFLMISCQKAGILIEKKLSGELSRIEKAELAVHLKVCNACRNYEKQSKLMDEALKEKGKKTKAPDDLKKKLKDKFN